VSARPIYMHVNVILFSRDNRRIDDRAP
jgi:hypothetical protein